MFELSATGKTTPTIRKWVRIAAWCQLISPTNSITYISVYSYSNTSHQFNYSNNNAGESIIQVQYRFDCTIRMHISVFVHSTVHDFTVRIRNNLYTVLYE